MHGGCSQGGIWECIEDGKYIRYNVEDLAAIQNKKGFEDAILYSTKENRMVCNHEECYLFKLLFYKCDKCKEYKPYTSYKPIIYNKTELCYITDINNKDGFLLDADGYKVYCINDNKCCECNNKKNEYNKSFKALYKTILQDCKIECECFLKIFAGFN